VLIITFLIGVIGVVKSLYELGSLYKS